MEKMSQSSYLTLKLLLLGSMILLSPGYLNCQTILTPELSNYIPNSPEANSIINYVKNPVSYDRGLAEISIPLYIIETGGIKIPITLSYHHKGLKANQFSTWLGQGWTLNAEPAITVQVNGKPDDYGGLVSPEDTRINRSGMYLHELASGDYPRDEYPDEYYYKLPDKNGAFLFKWIRSTDTFKPITSPYSPLKIVQGTNKLFEITDENGIYYRFGRSLNGSIFTEHTTSTTPGHTSQWKCTEIISATKGDTVRFNYTHKQEELTSIGDFVTVDDVEYSRPYGKNVPTVTYSQENRLYTATIAYRIEPDPYGIGDDRYIPYLEDHAEPGNILANKSYLQTFSRIESITFKNGKISFIQSSGRLQEIKITDNRNTLIRRIILNNRLVETNYPMLESVHILDTSGTIIEKYAMTYNGDPSVFQNYITSSNYWGYTTSGYSRMNAVQMNHVPMYYIEKPVGGYYIEGSFPVGYQYREEPAIQTGILKTITNPLGRKTEFIYEPDCYMKQVREDPFNPYSPVTLAKTQSGGLRIREIIDTDTRSNKQHRRTFKYGELEYNPSTRKYAESGNGIIKRQIYPESYMSTQELTENSVTSRYRTFTPWLNGDISFSGSPIVYPIVTEYTYGYENGILKDNGKTIYTYNYPISWETDALVPGTNIYLDRKTDWGSGQLVSREDYKRTGDESYTRIYKKHYTYILSSKDAIPVGQPYRYRIYKSNDSYQDRLELERSYRYYTHSLSTGAIKLSKETDSLFTDNGIYVTEKSYGYSNPEHLFPSHIYTVNSDGNNITQYLKYPLDASSLTDASHTAAKTELVNRWIISPVLEERNETDAGSNTTYLFYKLVGTNRLPLPAVLKQQHNNLSVEERIIYHNYDQYGNPVYMTKDNAENIVYLWGYKGQYPIAEIKNATYTQVKNALGGTAPESLSSADTFNETLIQNMRNSSYLLEAHVTTFSYKKLIGVVSITDPRGMISSYEYDNFGRLKETGFKENGKAKTLLESFEYNYVNP